MLLVCSAASATRSTVAEPPVTVPLFFADADRLRACAVGDVVDLDGPEGHHAATVRRLTVGEKLDLADGDGLLCSAEVTAVVGHALRARVLTRTQLERPQPRVTVVQALAKGDRDERAVEALTEVGVDADGAVAGQSFDRPLGFGASRQGSCGLADDRP